MLDVIRYDLTLESIKKKRTIWKKRRGSPQSAALTAPLLKEPLVRILTFVSIRKKRTLRKKRRRNPQSAALTASCRGGTTFVACATFPPPEESPLLKEPLVRILTLVSIRKKRTLRKNRRRNPQSAALTAPLLKEPLARILTLESIRKKRTLWKKRRRNPQSAALTAPLLKEPLVLILT